MGKIKYFKIEMVPQYFAGQYNTMICGITVKVYGQDEYHLEEIIPNNDFMSRVEWLVERAIREVKSIQMQGV